jgi:tRNA(Ile)-lysidine synthase
VTAAAQACLKLKHRPLSGWPVGLQRRVIQLQLQQRKIASDFELVESLRLNPGKIINVSPRISVSRDGAWQLQLLPKTSDTFSAKQVAVPLGDRAGEAVFDGVRLQWRFDMGKKLKRVKSPSRCEFFDADRVGAQVVLRHWQAGDRFQPIGMRSAVKLQDWFTNQKIARTRRHQLIVAAGVTGEIFWIEGLRIGERFKLTPPTKRRLIWRWKRL